jgi:hypothetical protein
MRQFGPTAVAREVASEDGSQLGLEFDHAILAILGELEASLVASQKALLARDLDRIRDGTEQQLRLTRALMILGAGPAKPGAGNGSLRATPFRPGQGRISPQLASAQNRVWHLARVQRALLRRAQQSLRMLTSLVAGPNAAYGPFQGSGVLVSISASPSGPATDLPCRV